MLTATPDFWLSFEDSSDDLVSINDGINQGNVQYVAGKVGKAAQFTGSEVVNVLKNTGALNVGSSNFTIEMWSKPEVPASNSTLFMNNGGVQFYALSMNALGQLRFDVRDASENYMKIIDDGAGSVNLADGNWHHLAAVRAGNTFTIYVDGVLRKSTVQSLGPIATGNSYVRVGGDNSGAGNETAPNAFETRYHGTLDEVSFYRTDLQAIDLQTIFSNGALAKSLPGPTLRLTSEGTIRDEASNLTSVGQGSSQIVAGLLGQAISFAGSQAINISKAASKLEVGRGDFSIQTWVKPIAESFTGTRAIYDNYGGVPMLALLQDPTGVRFRVRDSNDNLVTVQTSTPINDGQWHRIVALRRGISFQLYVDGAIAEVTNSLVGNVLTSNSYARVGGSNTDAGHASAATANSAFYRGLIDDVAFYPRALTNVEIVAQPIIELLGPTSAGIGESSQMQVVVKDQQGNVQTNFSGRLLVTSSDRFALLPSEIVFSAADNGTKNFDVEFGTVGSMVLRVALADAPYGGYDAWTTSVTTSEFAFAASGSYAGFSNLRKVAAGHFNADQYVDLVVADTGTTRIRLLLGNGDGTFSVSSATNLTNPNPFNLTTSDLNGDGKLDVIVADTVAGTINVLLGDGLGAFSSNLSYSAGLYTTGVTTGDFNGDGKLDVATANFDAGTISILSGNGQGAVQKISEFFISTRPIFVQAADMNKDSKVDLVVVDALHNTASVLLGNGNGTFAAPLVRGVGSYPYRLVIADFDRDSVLDVATSNYEGDSISILQGLGNGSLAAATTYSFPASLNGAIDLSATDLNGDNLIDIVVGSQLTNQLSFLRGRGDGQFDKSTVVLNSLGGPSAIAIADFDGNGSPDIALSTDPGGRIETWRNLKPFAGSNPPLSNPGGPYTVAAGTSIMLNGGASSDPNADIVSYEWDFNYDGLSFDVNAIGVSVTYLSPSALSSTRQVALRVTDSGGRQHVASTTVTILGAVSKWNFAEGVGVLANDSVGTNHGTLVNGPVWSSGAIDGALRFDGVNDYIQVPDSSSLDVTTNLTVASWVKFTSIDDSYDAIALKGSSTIATNYESFSLQRNRSGDGSQAWMGKISFGIETAAGRSAIRSTLNPIANIWYHIVGTYDGNTQRLYVNGNLESQATIVSSIIPTNEPFLIGRYNWPGNTGDFAGEMEEVSIDNRAISPSEVLARYQATPPRSLPGGPYTVAAGQMIQLNGAASTSVRGSVASYEWDLNYDGVNFNTDATGATPSFDARSLTNAESRTIALRVTDSIGLTSVATTTVAIAGRVSLWSFSEGTGTIAGDSVGENDGQLINGPVWTNGSTGTGLKFDGVNDYVEVPDHPSLDFTNALTMVAWVRMDVIDNQYETFIWKDDPGAPNLRAYSLARVREDGSGGSIFGKFYSTLVTTNGRTEIFSSRRPVAGQWYQVVSTYDGTQHKLYVNGVLESFETFSGTIRTTNGPLQFGRTAVASIPNSLRGNLDEVSLYNRTLSATEIQSTFLIPPTAIIQGSSLVLEGSVVAYNGGGSSVTGDAVYEWDFDYQRNSFTVDSTGVTGNFNAGNLDDPMTRTIALRVTDVNGLSDIKTLVVSLVNVAPTVQITNLPEAMTEGAQVTLGSTVTDPGLLDTHSYLWSVTKNGFPYPATNNQNSTFIFVPIDEGQYGINLVVADDDGGVGSIINSQTTYEFDNLAVGGLIGQDSWYKVGNESWNKNGYVYSGLDNSGPGSGKYLGPEAGRNGVLERLNNSAWSYSIPESVSDFSFEFDAKNLHGGGHYVQENGVWWETYLLQLGIGPVYVGVEGGNINRLAIWTNTGAWYATSPIVNPGNSWHLKAQIHFSGNGSGTISLLAEDKGNNLGLLPVSGLANVPMNAVSRASFNSLFVRLQSGEFSPLIDNLRISIGNTISVLNVPPTIALSGNTTVAEGSPYTLNLGAVTDPGADTVSHYIVHWGDGTSDTYSHGGPVTHTYANGLVNPGSTQPVRLISPVSADSFITDAAGLGGPSSTHGQDSGLWSINYFTPGAGGSLATRPLFKFDLSNVPSFTAAGDATFRVYLSGPNNLSYYQSTARRVDLYQVNSAWDEASVSWSNRPSTSYLNSADIVYVGDNRWVEWRVPQALLQQWLDNPSSNHGLMLVNELPDSFLYDLVFASREQPGNTAAQLLFGVTGPTTIRVDLRDEDGLHTSAGALALTVNNVPPTANPGGPYIANEGTSVTLDASASSDPGNDIVRYEWDLDYQTGGFTADATGSTYVMAAPDGPLAKSIALRVIDADGAVSSIVTTSLNVVNLPPALTVTSPAMPVLENSLATASGTYSDPGVDVVTLSANIGVILVSSGGAWTWSFDVGDAVGLPVFVRISATDEDQDSTSITFPMTVIPVNDSPSFVKGPDLLLEEDAGLVVVEPWASLVSPGPDNESTQVVSFEVVAVGTPTLFIGLPTVAAAGSLRLATAANAYGTSTVSLRLKDDGGIANGGVDSSETQVFTITISPVNDAPIAFDDVAGGLEDQPIAIAVLQNDSDVDSSNLVPSIVSQPIHGTVEIQPDGKLRWNPEANWYGTTQFTYRVSDGMLESNLATVTLNVAAVNDAPTIPVTGTGGPYFMNEGQPLTLNGVAVDLDSDILTYAWDINGDGNFSDAFGASVTLSWSQLGAIGIDGQPAPYTVSLRVFDGLAATTASTSLSVQNLAPNVTLTASRTQAVTMQEIQFVATATDPSLIDTLSYSWNFGDGSPAVTLPNATHAYSSAGTYQVTISVTDDEGAVTQHSTALQISKALREGGTLWLGGTIGDDVWTVTAIPVTPANNVYTYGIRLNSSSTTNYTDLSFVITVGGLGADRLILNGNNSFNSFEIREEEINLQSVAFRTTNVESRSVNALGTGDLVTFYGGQATLNGGAGNDTLIAASGGQHLWSLTGPNTGSLDGQLSFSSMEILIGDVQDDEFKFGPGAYISTSIDGNSGNNRLDFTDSSSAISVNLQTSRVTNAGLVSNVQRFIGGSVSNSDTFIATNSPNIWSIDGSNSGLLNDNIRFEGFENLTGGSADDRFVLVPGGSTAGTVNGGSGGDVADFSALATVTVNLADMTATKVGRILGIEKFQGSATYDFFIGANNTNVWRVTATGGSVDGVLFESFETWHGGSATDTLIGADAVTNWVLDSADGGFVAGYRFAGIENLTGNAQIDTFSIVGAGTLSGTLNGGSGSDVVDFSGSPDAVTVDLSASSSTKIASVLNISQWIGSISTDTLIGANNSNIWTVTSFNEVNVDGVLLRNFETLVGGNASDTFRAKELVEFLGTVDGGSGIDKLDYATFASAVTANLTTGAATGFTGQTNIENLTGGSGDDFLIGNALDNIILGGSGDDILLGLAGADSLSGNNGRDLIFGGSGTDTLHGNNGDDILVGGKTTYADEVSGIVHRIAIVAILSEWRRTDSAYAVRISRIKGLQADGLNTGFYLDASTVLDDLASDILWGDANTDWFWASSNDTANSASGEKVSS